MAQGEPCSIDNLLQMFEANMGNWDNDNTEVVRKKLEETGDFDRLKYFMKCQLAATPWKSALVDLCRDYVRQKGPANISYDDLVNLIMARGRETVPESIKIDALQKIEYCYERAVSPPKTGRL